MKNKYTKRLIIAGLLLALLVLIRFSGIGSYINFDFFSRNQQYVRDLIAQYPVLSRVLFILLYIVIVTFGVPISIALTVAGGYFFGAMESAIYTILSATTGALISFLTFRYLLYDAMHAKYGKKLRTLTNNIKKYGANYILFMQLLPITPFAFIIIACSLAGISAWTFAWATAVGITPGTFIYAYAGQQLGQLESFGGIFAPKFVIPLMLLALLALLPIALRYFKIIK